MKEVMGQAWRKTLLQIDATISDAICCLNETSTKIVIILNRDKTLAGTISDGDIRRGLLKGFGLDDQVKAIVHENALVVPPDLDREMVIQLMLANKIQQIPIVDEQRIVVGLHLLDEITVPDIKSNTMVIMAGGSGTRLRPHTESCPKPMLLIAGKPMLEHIIDRAKLEGFKNFIIAIHYLGHVIESYFGNGDRLEVTIDYLREKSPRGTAGALGLIEFRPKSPFVVVNGDVMSDIQYSDMIEFHTRHNALGTMAVRAHEWQHPFGVVQTQGLEIVGFEEKPISRTYINAGVYVLDPNALNFLTHESYCDMPTLFERMRDASQRTVAYPMHEPWLDVGRPEDLKIANMEKAIFMKSKI